MAGGRLSASPAARPGSRAAHWAARSHAAPAAAAAAAARPRSAGCEVSRSGFSGQLEAAQEDLFGQPEAVNESEADKEDDMGFRLFAD